MKVLIYGINYWPELAGIGKYTGEMAEWLASHGHEIRIVTAPPYYPQWCVSKGYSGLRWRSENIHDVRVFRCPLWVPSRLSAIKRVFHLGSFALSSAPVMLLQIFWRPDVVLVIKPPILCAPTAVMVARLCRAKAWLHVQDFEIDAAFDLGLVKGNRARSVVKYMGRLLMGMFDRVSTLSEKMVQRLGAKSVPAERRVLFPNWVDTRQIHPLERISSLREQLGFKEIEIVALYSGNMGQKQGLEIVINAAKLLVHESGLRFIMCGEGAAYERLRKLGEGLGNIMWLPLQPAEKLNELLNAADIHLLPQRADAADLVMPSKLTGILASGRPVVATADSGTEVWNVVQGRGLVVAPGDTVAFAEAIRTLAADAEQRKILGRAAREYAVAELDKEKVLSRFEAALKAVVDEREMGEVTDL